MIAFKRIATVDEWNDAHPKLREILSWLVRRWPDAYMEVTRIYSPPVKGESGVHRTRPHRAADLRTNDMTAAKGRRVADTVNAAWSYGHSRYNVAFQHGRGANRHLHVQVRDRTKLRGKA